MQKIIIPILSISLISSIIYANSIETNPEAIIEKENREAILECLENVYTKTGATDMVRQIKECESIPLRSITWTGQLTPASEPPSINNWLDVLHKKVCQKQINSPLCKDRTLFDRLYHITEERLPGKQFYPILLGITNAESSLGLDFAKDRVWWFCNWRNNWWWTKYQIHDDNTRTYSRELNWFLYGQKYSGRFVDQFGCNLYPFESIEEFWITKVNGMRYGYKWCIDSKTPIRCLSYKYVGNPDVAEESWIRNVSVFLD